MERQQLPTELSTDAMSEIDLESLPTPPYSQLSGEPPPSTVEMTKFTRFENPPDEFHPNAQPKPPPMETHPPDPPANPNRDTVITVHQVELVQVVDPRTTPAGCCLMAVCLIIAYYLVVGYIGKLLMWSVDSDFGHRFGEFWSLHHYVAVFVCSILLAIVYGISRACRRMPL